jgi:chorismate mutase / prephenate dehydratase
MRLEELREEIDVIDAELLRLINRRAQVALRAGALKQTAGLPLCDPERECHVLARARLANDGPLSDAAVANIFRLIIEEARRLEITTASRTVEKVQELT